MAIAVAEVVRGVAARKTDSGTRMGEELEKVRRERNLTQQQLATRLGMSLQGYLGYRKGYSKVTEKSLVRWATAFGLPATKLAKRLGIELVLSDCPGDLRGQLTALFGSEQADDLEQFLRDTAELPPEDQQQVLGVALDYVAGRKARRQQSD